MKLMPVIPLALVLGITLGLNATSSRAAEPPSPPLKLGGTWKLNKELSDDPTLKMREAMRDAEGAGGRGGRPGGGGPGMGGPGGGGGGGMAGPGGRGPGGRGGGGFFGGEPPLDGTPGQNRPEDETGQRQRGRAGRGQGDPQDQGGRGGDRGPMGPIPSPQLTIEQEGDNLAFRTENNLRLLHSDGEKRKKEGDFGRLEVVTRLVKGSLLIETRPEAGGKRKETYTLLPDGKLQIEVEYEGGGRAGGLKFKLVYDAAPPPAASF